MLDFLETWILNHVQNDRRKPLYLRLPSSAEYLTKLHIFCYNMASTRIVNSRTKCNSIFQLCFHDTMRHRDLDGALIFEGLPIFVIEE
jgi:hypothetical protein